MSRDDIASLVQSLGDDALAGLAQQRFQLEVRLGEVVAGTQDDINLRARLAEIGDVMSGRAQMAIGALESDVRLLMDEAGDYRTQIRQAVLGGSLSSTTVAQIYALQQEADVAQRQYSTLLSRLRDVESQALVQVADSRLVSRALAPSDPSFPKAKVLLGMAAVLSLGVGVCLAFANEYYYGGVTSLRQLENIVSGRVAASVPELSARRGMLCVADTVVNAPLSVFSESLRRVRSSIETATHRAMPRCPVVMVSSGIPGEGKTTIALALARTYAMAGKRTLLIDADLRKPSLHTQLGIPQQIGLLDYLKEQAECPVKYANDPLSDVQVMLGGDRSDFPTDRLLDSDRFDSILQDACARMDIVIVDTSPTIPIVDARYVARRADVIVQCVGYCATTQSDVHHGHAELLDSARSGTPILFVLNRDETKIKSYQYSGYHVGEAAV
jgi:capsular exopolysaccharide synthesis family protein